MKVIPPGLDFSSLKVALPEDPARKEMEQMKPAYNARVTASPRRTRQTTEEPSEPPKGMRPSLLLPGSYPSSQTFPQDAPKTRV